MAIVLPNGRPAIDVIGGSYDLPDDPWSMLGDAENRNRLEAAIAAVGRVDYIGHPYISWGGTAFVVGPDLIMTAALGVEMLEWGKPPTFIPGRTAVIDFGHERLPSPSLRVNIEEIVYVDPVAHIELVRAKLPRHIVPLKLSLSGYDDLERQAVAVIGYPAWDTRVEASANQSLFRGILDIKRILPGRTLGRGIYNRPDGPLDVLLHDCTTTGGCGGAPLVEIGSGHVVGIHFGGSFLKENYAFLAAELNADRHYVGAGVEFAGGTTSTPAIAARGGASTSAREVAVVKESEALPRATASADEENDEAPFGLEAIVLQTTRPVLPAESWANELDGEWQKILKPNENRLNLALRSVGKLFTDIEKDFWVGTAFLVGKELALTASYGLGAFVDGAGIGTSMKPGAKAAIDFSEALGKPPKSAVAAVKEVKFIHPFFHLALLELDAMPEGTAVLHLASQLPTQLANRPIALLSFATTWEPPFDKMILRRKGSLFVQPGKARQIGQVPESVGLTALVHDCTNTTGSAGGPVLDLGTGYAIGVHTHGRFLELGYAQAIWEFARDPYVWRYAIELRPDPRPSWLSSWDASLSKLQQKPVDPPPKGGRWTVDDVPIDWSRTEPKELEKLLVASIEPQQALLYAENAGLPSGAVSASLSGVLLWRDILKKASVAGVLRRMLQELVGDSAMAGLAPKLAKFL